VEISSLDVTQEESSTGLIERARTDRTAFSELFRRHYDEIFRYCARRLTERQTAEDITSQVFMKMLKNFKTFMGDETAFRCWLFRIACNEINSHFRTVGRRVRAMEAVQKEYAPDNPDVRDDCEQAEDNAVKVAFLNDAIAALKQDQQDIITLRFFEGLNSEQIGEVLGLKATTVRSRLARALKKLKTEYKTRQQHLPEGVCWYE
jgi:RNA polymerase sigma-70 factor (ECF subfamily)